MRQCYEDREILCHINELLEVTEFARGEIKTPFYRYIYLIEGWEAECIAEQIMKEDGDWDDDEYIYEMIRDKHDEVFEVEFVNRYRNFEVLRNEVVDGCQFGVSVIVIKVPINDRALTGFKVLTFEPSVEQNKKLLEQLSKAAQLGGKKAYDVGIFTARPNEAGNHIEPFVIDALKDAGLKADKPVAKSSKRKAAGYPDIQIEDEWNRTIYLDCKTYNTLTKDQTFRTFYFSPSKDPKITRDAFHLLMSFELDTAEREGRRAFIPISWQIYTLDKLLIQVKHEFNASNKDLYTKEALLAQGRIRK